MEGYIDVGMSVTVDLGSLGVTVKVASMEVIDVDYLNKSYKGLAFAYDDPEELEFWKSFRLSDETFVVERLD